MGTTLYKLTAEMQMLLDMAEDPECDPQAIADTLEGLQYDMDEKFESYCCVLRQLEADQYAVETEEKRFNKKKQTIKNNIDRMKQAMQNAMVVSGRKEVRAGLFNVKLQNNGGLKPIVFDGEVPDEFVRFVPQNDTAAIRAYLDGLGDGECEWAHYGDRGQHIAIK